MTFKEWTKVFERVRELMPALNKEYISLIDQNPCISKSQKRKLIRKVKKEMACTKNDNF